MKRPPYIANTTRPELARDLGISHASAVVVGTIIGSGIFLVPAEMMQAVGSAKLVYLAWLVGGLLSFFGALTYAELGAMKPQAGGEYVYVRDAYGPLGGFLYAWTWFVIAKPASIATIATGLVRILGTFPIFSFFPANAISVPFSITWGQLVAIAAAILISVLNYLGVKKAGEFQLVFTVLKVAIILGIVAICFSGAGDVPGRGWSNFAGTFTGAKGGIAGFMAALVAALWAYDGWNDLNMVAGEVKRPERNIPIALIAGVATVGVLYVLVNAGVQYVLPANAIAASPRPASDAVALVMGRFGASIVSAGMAVSMLVTLNGTIMSGARIPYAVARDGYFFRALAEVHPRFHTPTGAIVLQAVLSIILLLLGGNFRQLFSLAIFAEWLFYMIAGSTVFVFRWRDPDAVRPYRMFGYPFVPAVFIGVAAALLYYTFTDNLQNSAVGCLVIGAGIPVFNAFARRRSEQSGVAQASTISEGDHAVRSQSVTPPWKPAVSEYIGFFLGPIGASFGAAANLRRMGHRDKARNVLSVAFFVVPLLIVIVHVLPNIFTLVALHYISGTLFVSMQEHAFKEWKAANPSSALTSTISAWGWGLLGAAIEAVILLLVLMVILHTAR